MLQKCNLIKQCLNESDNFINYAKQLREKIRKMYITSPHVLISKIEDEFFEQNGIKYLIKLLKVDNLSKKPINNIEKKEFKDPFAPPFEPDYVIEEDFAGIGQHRILFNRYPIMSEHLLLTTREYIDQSTHLDINDFSSLFLMTNLLNGFVFFNGGIKSGSSQPHKHMQCIPLESIYNGNFGLFELIRDDSNLIILNQEHDYRICQIKQFYDFEVPHRVIKFSKETSDYIRSGGFSNVNEISLFLLNLYKVGLNDLGLYDDEENITQDYSFLYTNEWMFLVPRKESLIKIDDCEFNLNSASYTLTILTRNQEQKEILMKLNIVQDLFKRL